MKIKDLPGPVLALAFLGLAVILFAINATCWWLAHQSAWWTYALAVTGGNLAWSMVKSTRQTLRERKQRRPA